MGLTLDELRDGDKTMQVNGLGVLIGEQDSHYTEGIEVDYIDDYRGKGLVINTGHSC